MVMRPRGPLPPRVYWTRRVLLVAVVMVVGALVWWMLPGVAGSGDAAANPRDDGRPAAQPPRSAGAGVGSPSTAHPSTTAPGDGGQTTTGQHRAPGGGTGHPQGTTEPMPGRSTHTPPTRTPPPTPTGPCDPTTVQLWVVVSDTTIGKGTTVRLRMATPDGSTCSLGITPTVLETRIVSGPAVIWQSRSCPDALPAKNVVVRPTPQVVYSYTWDGQLNPSSCSATDRIAKEGTYHAQAALIGGEPHDTSFVVTSTTP